MAHQVVLSSELGRAHGALEARRYSDTLVPHVSLQVAFSEVALVAYRAKESLAIVLQILTIIHHVKRWRAR